MKKAWFDIGSVSFALEVEFSKKSSEAEDEASLHLLAQQLGANYYYTKEEESKNEN